MTQAEIARAVLDRARGRRNPVQITDDGRRALDAVWDLALSTDDLSDAGLTAPESAELNRLLLKLVRATQGTHPGAVDDQYAPSLERDVVAG